MGLISPADIWRIVKDVDLEGIARSAQQRVDLLVASDDGEDGARFCAWLACAPTRDDGGAPVPHPWLTSVAAQNGLPALSVAPAAAVLVSRGASPGSSMVALRDHLARYGVPIVTVALGATERSPVTPMEGERGGAHVVGLDADAKAPVAAALLPALPRELHIALARAFPPLRQAVTADLIEETARANASYAFTTGLAESVPVLAAPLAVGDMVMLTKNQLLMCYRILLAHGRNGGPRHLIGEVVGVLGGGLLLRQAARQLVGLVPVLGIVPKVVVAYAGTWAVGRAMAAWASEGREVAASAVRRYSREGLARGRIVARALYEGGQERAGSVTSRLSRFGRPRDV